MNVKNCSRFDSLSLNMLPVFKFYFFTLEVLKLDILQSCGYQVKGSTSTERILTIIKRISSFKKFSRKLIAFFNLLHLYFWLQKLYVANS